MSKKVTKINGVPVGHTTTIVMSGSSGGGGQTENFSWIYKTGTTPSDPGTGNFKINNAALSATTELYIDSQTKNGIDIDTLFSTISGSWDIYLQDSSDSSKNGYYSTVVSSWVNNSGWWKIPVTKISSGSGSTLTNNTTCAFLLINKNGTNGVVPTTTTININGVLQDLSTNRSWKTGLADTGALTYSGISIASSTGRTVNISAVTGLIVDNETNPNIPTYTYVNYSGQTNVLVPTVTAGTGTYVLLKSNGTIQFQNTYPTSSERKSMIWLSKLGHPDSNTLSFALNETDFINSPIAQLRDLEQALGYVNDGVYPSANGTNLNFNTSIGNIHINGGNFVNDKIKPNEVTMGGPVTQFVYRTQTGGTTGLVSVIDPTKYDNGGVITTVPGGSNASTNQYIFAIPGSGFAIQYGQTTYSSLVDAIAAVGKEDFIQFSNLRDNAILVGVLSVIRTATALNDPNQARFFKANKLGEALGIVAGTSVTTLQQAYNNSLQPQITTDVTRGAIQIKGYDGGNARIIETQNSAGTTTMFVTESGSTTAQSFIKSGGTANQILAANGSVITAGSNITISGGTISATGGGGGGATNLSYSATPYNGIVISDTGTDAIIPAVTTTEAGLLEPTYQPRVTFLPGGKYFAFFDTGLYIYTSNFYGTCNGFSTLGWSTYNSLDVLQLNNSVAGVTNEQIVTLNLTFGGAGSNDYIITEVYRTPNDIVWSIMEFSTGNYLTPATFASHVTGGRIMIEAY